MGLILLLVGCSTHQNLMSCSRILNSIKGFKFKTATVEQHNTTNTICEPVSCGTAYEGAVTSSATQKCDHSAAPPWESAGASVAQEPLITLTTPQQAPPQTQEQPTRPSHQQKKSKSKDGQGVKQSRNNKTTDGAPVCWRCGEPGHQKKDCHKPPFCGKCRKEGHVPALCPLSKGLTQPSPHQQQVNKFSNPANRCIHCGGEHAPASCPTRYQPKATPSTSSYVSPKRSTRGSQSTQRSATPTLFVNNVALGQVRGNQVHQVTPQVSPNIQQNLFAPPTQSNSFPPPPYFPIPFPPPPVPPSNVSTAPSAPASDLSAAISLMTNAVNQGNANTMTITDALQGTTTQFVDALQQTIQREWKHKQKKIKTHG